MTARMPQNQREGVRVTEVASTPSSISAVASPVTLDQLEFAAALAAVATRAVSPLGAARVRERVPRADPGWIREQLTAAAELAAQLGSRDPFHPEPVEDLSGILATLAVAGSVLEGLQLVGLARALGAMRAVARELARVRESAPRAAALLVDLPPREIEQAINRALDPDGAVRDDASPDLKRARSRVRETRARLVALLESSLSRLPAGDRAAEAGVTVKDGRYVIPVRRGGPRVSGIVHGASSSGATLFVEPPEAVSLGNELRESEADEARAVLAVLRGLTDRARGAVAPIAAGWEMCIAVDDLYARARYAGELGGALPQVAPAPAPLRIRAGRHPLLLAEGVPVVPFDLTLGGDAVALVISGPNTGGKTVLLKAVGLMAALAQAGIIPPVAEGTALPVFGSIFADIGDHQSIAASLSTFSAHVGALREILTGADPASLVLVDEIGNGTDPLEGGALAAATLRALVRRRATAIVTTHLAQLKDVAAQTPGVENASLEFDAQSLVPTYRFLQGVPGRSYGLAVAQRLGVPSDVLAEAQAAIPEAQRSLEALLADLEAKTQEVERREREAAAREAALDRREGESGARAAELAERARALREEQRQVERSGREQARRFLLEARRRVDEALALARAAVSEATAKEARRLVEDGVRQEAEALKKLDAAAKGKGWRLNGAGSERATPHASRPAGRGDASLTREGVRTELDLRGLTVDEATAALTAAVDDAVVNDLPYLRVIHGKGTGALREAVQSLLAQDGRVAGFRLAPPQQGGAGVTLVDLKP